MDLKIKDVADLLNVSETTIRRWITDGKIPAYRLNHQYRFSRIEIENWVMGCKLSQQESGFSPFAEVQIYPPLKEGEQAPTQRAGQQQFSLYRALHQGGVFADIPGKTKEEIIHATMERISGQLGADADVLSELLLDREEMAPTALNNGVAVPHTRDSLLQGPYDMIFVVFPSQPIEYGALDGQPVHTLFFLFSNADKRHLHLLAKLAHLSSSDPALELLKKKPDSKELLTFIRDWESHITP